MLNIINNKTRGVFFLKEKNANISFLQLNIQNCSTKYTAKSGVKFKYPDGSQSVKIGKFYCFAFLYILT